MPGGSIGDLYYAFRGDGARLKADAKREGEKAGEVGGKSFSKKFGGEVSKGLKQGLGIGAGLGAASVVAGGIQAIGDAFQSTIGNAIAFEKAMANVNSIAKFTDEELGDASDAVLKLSGDFGQSAQTMAEGLYDISSSGFQGAEALEVLEASTKAATAGLATTAQSASGVTAVLNAYNLGAEDAAHVSDVLFETVNRGVITFPELADQIGKTTALSAPLGVALEEVAAATALMTRNGVGAEETFTQINAIMNAMLKPSVEAATLAEELGLQWNATSLRANGLVGSMQELVKATGGSHEKMAILLGDSRAIRGAFVLAQKSGKAFRKELGFMEDAAGATDEAFKIQSESTAFQIAQMQAKIEAAGIEIGETFLPILADLAELATEELVPALEAFADAMDAAGEGAADNSEPIGNLANLLHDLFKDTEEDSRTFIGAVGDALNNASEGVSRLASDLNDAWTFWDKFTLAADDARIATDQAAESARESGRGWGVIESGTKAAAGGFDDLEDKALEVKRSVRTSLKGMTEGVEEFRDTIINAARNEITTAWEIIDDRTALSTINHRKEALLKIATTRKWTSEEKAEYDELTRNQEGLILDLAENGVENIEIVKTAIKQIEKDLKTATGQRKIAMLALLATMRRLEKQTNDTAAAIKRLKKIAAFVESGLGLPGGDRGRQHGGPVSAGTLYEVNEGAGQREYFAPNVSGYVYPDAQAVPLAPGGGSSGGVTINLVDRGVGVRSVRDIASVTKSLRRQGYF